MTGQLRVGVQLPEVERDVRWPELVAMARAAEEVGFDSIWVGDHLLYRGDDRPERGPWDAWTTLSALAASTQRVRLGPLVACAAFHPPGILARMAAAIDEISGGRFVLGIGAGWNRTEFDAFGIDYDRRASRFEEAFDLIRRLLDGERVTAQGRFHRVEDAVLLPPPARRVPLMVGSNGDRLLRAALPHVDAWNTWFDDYGNTPEGFADLNARVSAARATSRGSCRGHALGVRARRAGRRGPRASRPGPRLPDPGIGLGDGGAAPRARRRRRRRGHPGREPDHRAVDPIAR
jgi:alkanesulfonate monooxygenase SsuD/methylene tetrahydromethanopterin reductase-like flavin-dependent oxidoreductase (luciferase family)